MSTAKEISAEMNCKCIFINTTGGIKELENRLINRGTETSEKIKKRLNTSKKELENIKRDEYQNVFNKILYNDDLEKCEIDLKKILYKWYNLNDSHQIVA